MGQFLRVFLKPLTRIVVGLIAIPLFRLFMRRVVRLQRLDAELEKDMEQWFRASLVLLLATRNMEEYFFHWVNLPEGSRIETLWDAFLMGMRLLLAMSVVEMMPDQELFAIIHPGPPKLKYDRSMTIWKHVKKYAWPFGKGLLCQHLNRSSPVFAILCAIAIGPVGWFCYGMALFQYLIIGLVTSKDKALDALTEFDRQVARRRRELLDEFDYIDERVEEKERNEPVPPPIAGEVPPVTPTPDRVKPPE